MDVQLMGDAAILVILIGIIAAIIIAIALIIYFTTGKK